jgi:hypothetical protein
VGREPLVGHVAELVAADQAVRDDEDGRSAPEVLDDAQAGRLTGRGAVGVVGRRIGEAAVELDEGGIARAAEAVDRLVVVAHDHHVVRPVRRPPEELDELDLGDVGILELIDEQVAEAALPAAQDVRAVAEEADDGGDLFPEVEGTAALPLRLVGPVDERELGEAQDLEGGAVGHVRRGKVLGCLALLVGQVAARDGVPGSPDGTASLAVGDLLDLLKVRVGGGVLGGGVLGGGRALGGPEGGVGAPRVVAAAVEGAEGLETLERAVVRSVPPLEGGLLGCQVRVEVVRADELVLGPVDERHEAVEPEERVAAPGVVEERQPRAEVAQEEHLADTVEDVGHRREARVGRGLDEDPVAEAVEVGDRQASAHGGPERFLEPVRELLRRLDVVGQDEDLLRQERTGEGVVGVGRCGFGGERQGIDRGGGFGGRRGVGSVVRCALRLQEAADPLHDDAGLAGPGPRDDDERTVLPGDDALLFVGKVAVRVTGRDQGRRHEIAHGVGSRTGGRLSARNSRPQAVHVRLGWSSQTTHPPRTTRCASRSASSCSLWAGSPYWILAIAGKPQRGQVMLRGAVFTGSVVASTSSGSSSRPSQP